MLAELLHGLRGVLGEDTVFLGEVKLVLILSGMAWGAEEDAM